MRSKYKANRNIVFSCKYHMVWCPKYRRSTLRGKVGARLKEILRVIADELRVDLIEIEVVPDHIHILCEVDPQFGVNKFVRHAKGTTSRMLREEFPFLKTPKSLRTNSYFVATVGGAPLSAVKRYITSQTGE